MITFKEFLTEMPRQISDVDFPYGRNRLSDNYMTRRTTGTKISQLGRYDVLHHKIGTEHVYRLHDPEKGETHLEVYGYHNGKEFTVHGAASHPKRTIRAHELYHHLITKHGLTIVSDNAQSHAGFSIWRNLSRMNNIDIKARAQLGDSFHDREVRDGDDDNNYVRYVARKK